MNQTPDKPEQPQEDSSPDNEPQRNEDAMRTQMDMPAAPTPSPEKTDGDYDPYRTVVDPFDMGGDDSAEPQTPTSESASGEAEESEPAATPQQAATEGKGEGSGFDPYATMFEQSQSDVYRTMPPTNKPQPTPARDDADEKDLPGSDPFEVEGGIHQTSPNEMPTPVTAEPTSTPSSAQSTGASGIAGRFDELLSSAQGPSIFLNVGRVPLLGLYSGVVALSALGLALFSRFLVLLLVYGDFEIGRFILGIFGLLLAVGFYIAFEYIPVLGGAQARLDRLDLEQNPNLATIQEPAGTLNPWLIGLAVLLTVTGLLGGGLIFDAWTSLNIDGVSQLFAIILGGFGGALIGGLSLFNEPRTPLNGAAERRFTPLQLVRPIGIGLGVVFLAAGLQLLRVDLGFEDGAVVPQPYAADVPIYFLLALAGMYGIGGQSLRVLPLRFHQWIGNTIVGLVSGVASVGLMSVFTMLLDGTDGGGDITVRFAYAPWYLIGTMDDSNIVLMSLFGVLLSAAGLFGGFLTLQSFGETIISQPQKRIQMLSLTLATIFIVMLPMLVIFPVLTVLPLGMLLEAWLLFLIPFVLLSALLVAVKTRAGFIAGMLGVMKRLVNILPKQTPPWLRSPLQSVVTTDQSVVQSLITWQRGIAFVVVFSAIAPTLALSFWFWILLLVGIMYGFSSQATGRPAPIASKPGSGGSNTPRPSQQPDSSSSAEANTDSSTESQSPRKPGPFQM
jgi:hypothetical protein